MLLSKLSNDYGPGELDRLLAQRRSHGSCFHDRSGSHGFTLMPRRAVTLVLTSRWLESVLLGSMNA